MCLSITCKHRGNFLSHCNHSQVKSSHLSVRFGPLTKKTAAVLIDEEKKNSSNKVSKNILELVNTFSVKQL